MKRILAFLCTGLIVLNGFSAVTATVETNVESAGDTYDEVYENAVEFLKAFSMNGNLNLDMPDANVSRADFASSILTLLGFQTADEGGTAEVNRNKYLGYTNEPDIDENGDWIWKTEEDSVQSDALENATPFYDVLSTDPEWEAIKMVAQIGIMRGDSDRYFRPDDAVTVQEAVKVLVDSCGAKVLTENNFPNGYIKIAHRLGLDEGVSVPINDSAVTIRDIAVLFYNAMHTEIYERVFYGAEESTLVQRQGKTLLKYIFDINIEEGRVTANSITGIDDYNGAGNNRIEINDTLFSWSGTEDVLAKNVRAYYKVDGTKREIKYLDVLETNIELIINAEDIEDYTLPYIFYWKNNKKHKISIGADVNLIYNGKALLNYTDDDLKPTKGRVRLLDSDDNGEYETVFVENVKTLLVSGIDTTNGFIYSNLHSVESLNLSKGNYEVYDAVGTKLELSNITRGTVISAMETKEAQGEKNILLYCSNNNIVASVEMLNIERRELVLNGITYKISKEFDIKKIQSGSFGTFYIDVYDEIVHYETEGRLRYGYLMAMQSTGLFDGEIQVKLYSVEDDEFQIYRLAEKLNFNKDSATAERVAENTLIYNKSKGKIIPQMIKFFINGAGEISEILTCNVIKEEFASMTNVSNEVKLQYRAGKVNAFIDTKDSGPLFYTDSETRVINIPKTDATDEDSFFPIAIEHDEYYYMDEVYKDGDDSSIGKVAVKISDAAANAVVEWGQPVYMVTEVEQTLIEGEDAYIVYGMSTNGDAQVQVMDPDLFDAVSTLEKGDLCRYELNPKDGKALLLEKVFDHKDMQIVKGFMKGINPFGSSENSKTKKVGFINELHLMHGEVVDITDKGAFLTVSPYLYEFEDNKITGIGQVSSVLTDRITYKASAYSVVVYDSNNDRVSNGSYNEDILDSANTINGSEVVVYSNWSSPRCIFVYK